MKKTKKKPHYGWRTFDKARKFVHELGLKSQDEWRTWIKSGKRPADIPSTPNLVYKDDGWAGFGDWLGTGRIASFNVVFMPFQEARTLVQNIGLQNQSEWRIWTKSDKRQDDIPTSPDRAYKDAGWISWGDWLGTDRVATQIRVFRSFEEARSFARNLGLKSRTEWNLWTKDNKRPDDVPANPYREYKNQGWISWGDWLGTDNISHKNIVYRPFEEAREFIHSLSLKSFKEWKAWAMSDARPKDIPSNPYTTYRTKEWKGLGDWLGTGNVAPKDRIYRPFHEARTFIKRLGLQSRKDWIAWAKTNARPNDIPANPEGLYKNKGWKGWGDWLGTGHVAQRDIVYRPFPEARAFIRSLELKTGEDYNLWAKSGSRPDDIPIYPDGVYKEKGWVSWGDYLGTGSIATYKMIYRSFEEAREFTHKLGFKNRDEWIVWSKSSERPEDIPATPERTYKGKGWASMGDWLGTGNIAPKDRVYRPFQEAREYVRNIGIKNKDEWAIWAKSNARPNDIPSLPSRTYQGSGWSGFGDWLGTDRIANQNKIYRSFQEARAYVRSLGLSNFNEWRMWAGSDVRPKDIPSNPAKTYNKNWVGLGDWLGVINLWNKYAVLSFLYGIKPVLRYLQPAELYAIMRQNGLIAAIRVGNSNAQLIKSIRDLCSSPTPESDFEKLIVEIERENKLFDEGIEEEQVIEVDISKTAGAEELPALRSMQALKAVDELEQAGIFTSDEETIEFLIGNRVSGLWQDMLNNGGAIDLETLRNEEGGVYFEAIRSRFLSQYDGAQSLEIPRGYDFRVAGKLAQPNLMQKLAAYRVLSEKRLGNWSGVGAGKTLSAILASRVVDARLTVIVAFNSTVEPWAKRVKETYPDSIVHIKERGDVRVDTSKHTYLILNFETFQQPDSAAMVERLVEKHKIDFVVLDEIQSVKQRTPKLTSKRRQVVSGLLSSASEKNPDLRVLGMSATPVINNLYEAKALLELVKGVSFDELETFSNIPNAIAMHEKLILYGIRYRPEYKQTIETEFKEIQANEYLSKLTKVRKGAILDLERVLLEAKLETILASLKKGTLIYTHYLTGLVTPLREAIENAGFKVGLFTGEDKSGLELFKKGKVDILIGSVPVGTGVDGLQYVCNRMIVLSLPWTNAEYEQLIGRLYRQGSIFEKVEIIVPQVVLEHNGDIWSWDKMRMNRIQYKKTLADAAMDGVIPEGELSSPEMMFKKAREALQTWIQRIEQDGIAIIERAQLRVPLPKETANIIQRRFGDLSVMNSRFNTAYSSTTHERLKQNPEEWYLYHTLYREARKGWAEIPFERIAKSLKKRPDWVIGDFGCGEAKLAALLPNKVYSFDHIAINENVLACDITHTPVEDGVLDVAVFSLSLMGLNYADYFKEAYRTLRFGGLLKIAEPISRWSEKRSELLSNISDAGFSLVGKIEESNQFLYIDAIKM